MMKKRILLPVSIFLFLYSITAFGSIGTLVSKTGKVFILRNAYYPVSRELEKNLAINREDIVFTAKKSKAFLRFSGEIPIFLRPSAY